MSEKLSGNSSGKKRRLRGFPSVKLCNPQGVFKGAAGFSGDLHVDTAIVGNVLEGGFGKQRGF